MIDRTNSRESHLWVEDRLSDYIDDRLPGLERVQLERHLRDCARCQRTLASIQWTVTLLKQAPSPKLPHSFTLPVPPQPARAPLFGLNALRLATALATLILVSLVGVDLIMQFGSGPLSSTGVTAGKSAPSQPTLAAMVPPAVPPTTQANVQVAPVGIQPTPTSVPTSAPAAPVAPAVPTTAPLPSGPSSGTIAPSMGAAAIPTIAPSPTAPSRLSAQPLAGTRPPVTALPSPTPVPFGRGGGGPPETTQSSKASTDTAEAATAATPAAPPKPPTVTDQIVPTPTVVAPTPTVQVQARVAPTLPVVPPLPTDESPSPVLSPLRIAEFGALFVTVFLGALVLLLRRR
ncbi:MAG: zf-HC2 domain-containing protein [Acidobacteriota bacterium]